MGTTVKDSYVPPLRAFSLQSQAACFLAFIPGRVFVQRDPLRAVHYANLIILSNVIDVSSHCEMKFGRWSVEDSTCNFEIFLFCLLWGGGGEKQSFRAVGALMESVCLDEEVDTVS